MSVTRELPLTREWLAQRLQRNIVLPDDPDCPRYVHPRGRQPIPAAVLIPIINHRTNPSVLLTQRTDHLHDHAGQISFPGGRVDEADPDRASTALREAEEELGLPRSRIEIVGRLPDYDIMTGFRVTPVVGWIEPPIELKPDRFEVAEVFEVPLRFFLDPANHQRHRRDIHGVLRHYYAMPFGQRFIWGATAGMLFTLYQVLSARE
ncbi:MAG TPA: CoA pyrophosphatase [Burkholderiales bacterium]|nr:CoA pyrophosphatase [Burkholderiales bacterium]